MAAARFRLHHAPRSRSGRALWMLEEAGAAYDIALHDLEQATQKQPGYLALNPAGKVPALEDRGLAGDWQGVVVTESAAICAYLADALPEAALAPPPGSPGRAAYADWMAWCPGVLEPAAADLVFPRAAPPPPRALGWPPFPETLARLDAPLGRGPWLLGEGFTAADVLIGSMLLWLDGWGKLAEAPASLRRYMAALEARPARQRALAADARGPAA
ncbi:glutathione S-transferase family protein [Roseicella sp. DB1501]|uniref:glutathione S-transferase family protein n=1 Tax=Roseicella sp. DB1501 TaxID=2730925 RepID=UPI0014929DC1|nr:glutathione S-transferase family protein [Roseicella sp. DB1501]NOG70347.1 glutathione S-transferase family protein [Roseicella sp. DB1501]